MLANIIQLYSYLLVKLSRDRPMSVLHMST